jgi:hypothetical protein
VKDSQDVKSQVKENSDTKGGDEKGGAETAGPCDVSFGRSVSRNRHQIPNAKTYKPSDSISTLTHNPCLLQSHPSSLHRPSTLPTFSTSHLLQPPPLFSFQSLFLSDVTVPDGTVYAPKADIFKVWRIINNGPTAWPRGCRSSEPLLPFFSFLSRFTIPGI